MHTRSQSRASKERGKKNTVGKVLLVYEMRRHVFPTAPSPTVTHFMNLVCVAPVAVAVAVTVLILST